MASELRNKLNNILEDHQACVVLAKSIGSTNVYGGTTATAEDLLEGKTAYSNGVLIEGTMSENNNNAVFGSDKSSSASYTPSITQMIKSIDFTKINLVGMSWTSLFSRYSLLNNIIGLEKYKPNKVNYMFNACESLIIAPKLDTSESIYFTGMFQDCLYLEEVPQYDASSAIAVQQMFNNCIRLKKFGGLLNLGKAYTEKKANNEVYTLTIPSSVDYESLMSIINGLYDLNLTYGVANGGTLYRQTLRITQTNVNKLTAEELAIATNKGWDVY